MTMTGFILGQWFVFLIIGVIVANYLASPDW